MVSEEMEWSSEALKKVKVVHLSTSDIEGGASIAAHRIHEALRRHSNVESTMLVRDKHGGSEFVEEIGRGRRIFATVVSKICRMLLLTLSREQGYRSINMIGCGIAGIVNSMDVDIVHIHWVQGEMLSIDDFTRVKKPTVVTLHDMWPICGLSHYEDSDLKQRGLVKVIDKKLKEKKLRKIWNKSWIHFTTAWMSEEAHSRGFPIENSCIVPYPGNSEVFFAEEGDKGLHLHDRLEILFGAQGGIHEARKGFRYLDDALSQLNKEGLDFNLKIFGCERPDGFRRRYRHEFVGTIRDTANLRRLYNGADIMVVPSTLEAFGQTASEAILCGTPVIAFTNTGTGSLICAGKNGYLCRWGDSSDLANTIRAIMADRESLRKMREVCEQYGREIWGDRHVASSYKAMYELVLKKWDGEGKGTW